MKKNLSDEDFARTAYVTLLSLKADASGLATWVKVLTEIGNREKIVKARYKSLPQIKFN